ncbi:hypothetical protein RBB50_008000 [Rhinocladiella similis]
MVSALRLVLVEGVLVLYAGVAWRWVLINLQEGCWALQALIMRVLEAAGGVGSAVPADQVNWLKVQARGLESKFRYANRACRVGGTTRVRDLGEIWQLPDIPENIFPREYHGDHWGSTIDRDTASPLSSAGDGQ